MAFIKTMLVTSANDYEGVLSQNVIDRYKPNFEEICIFCKVPICYILRLIPIRAWIND